VVVEVGGQLVGFVLVATTATLQPDLRDQLVDLLALSKPRDLQRRIIRRRIPNGTETNTRIMQIILHLDLPIEHRQLIIYNLTNPIGYLRPLIHTACHIQSKHNRIGRLGNDVFVTDCVGLGVEGVVQG
jgi:hypothetical protein